MGHFRPPCRDSERKQIWPGIRTVTNKSFVFCSEIDEPSSEVKILGVFFRGADRRRQILDRSRH
jgi:hypothetical protein